MGNEWRFGRLDELVDFLPKRTIKKGAVAPFIAMADIPENSREPANISQKEFKGGGSKFCNGDTVFARITPCLQNGKTAKISGLADGDIAHGSTEFIILGAKESIDQGYIYYLSRLPEFRAYAESRMEGSTGRQRVAWQALAEYELSFPPKKGRGEIGKFLGSLDNKIQLNRQTNQTLEQMAQALFKSWFVDFDPVIDNALAAGNPIPDELQEHAQRRQQQLVKPDHKHLPDDIRQLFPSEFELTEELGWVPMGWEVTPLYLLADFINGAAYKKFEPNTTHIGLPIIKIAELKSGIKENTGYSDIEMPDKYLIRYNDILFSWSGNPDTSIDTFVWSLGNAWLNQHIFRVVPANDIPHSFLLAQLRHLKPVFTEIARDKQTTGLGHVTVKDLKALMVVIPSNEILGKATELLKPMFEKSLGIKVNSQELTKLRDTLLPKLISGELRLPSDALADVEQQPTNAIV